MIEGMDKALKGMSMVIHMKDILKKEKLMAKVCIFGQMEKFMKDLGLMGKKMDMEVGKIVLKKAMWVIGKRTKQMVKESIFGVQEIVM
jgi:hypothetical protein